MLRIMMPHRIFFPAMGLLLILAHGPVSDGQSTAKTRAATVIRALQLSPTASGSNPAVIVDGTGTAVSAVPAEAAAADTVDASADQAKQQRMQLINSLQFDRRPSAILKLWSEKGAQEASQASEEVETTSEEEAPERNGDGAATGEETSEEDSSEEADEDSNADLTDEERAQKAAAEEAARKADAAAAALEEFRQHLDLIRESVTLGLWGGLPALLNDRDLLTEEESSAVYSRMLQQLSAQAKVDFEDIVGISDEMRAFMESMANRQQNSPAAQLAEKHLIRFEDILGMIRSAPEDVELEEQHLNRFATLLRLSLGEGNQLEGFLSQLKEIDPDVLTPVQAATILSRAGRNMTISEFLPAEEAAVQEKKAAVLNLWARYYLAVHREEGRETDRERAWQATLNALNIAEPGSDEAAEALNQAVTLAPQLREELGRAWLQESFRDAPERGRRIMSAIGVSTAQRLAQLPQDSSTREAGLKLQAAAVEALLSSGTEIDDEWRGILNLLGSNWLQEAEATYQYSGSSRFGPQMQRDAFGNIYYLNPNAQAAGSNLRMGQLRPVDAEAVLETAPEGRWMELLNPSLRPRFTMTLCRLWLKLSEDARAFPFIEQLAETHPKTATELAEEFLRVWTRNHNPNARSSRTNSYMFIYGYEQKADRIPLTRARQERNIRDLSEWIGRLTALPIEAPDESLLLSAFMTCHSVAEVYDREDIETIFGQWESLQPDTMAALIQKMRSNLAGTWQDPNVQRDAGTKRSKADIQEEVMEGYRTAESVLADALAVHPGDWRLLTARASIQHDRNDFSHSVAPSAAFSDRRREALALFEEAAQQYVEGAGELPERERSTEAFEAWFYAALGAADLGRVSEENQPAASEFPKIRAALEQFSGELRTWHTDRFANLLFTRMSAVNPACKFRYVSAGFEIVDDNPQAEEARRVYEYYRDLDTEIDLAVRVDGDTRVGSEEPFGLYVSLVHSREVERESGGFGKYLQNQNNALYAYNYGRPTANYRDKFQDSITATLQEHFEVLSVTFNKPEVRSRPAGPAGMRETPYAHILLKARGPEVDKIPALSIDLDFLDTSGYVVLPIASVPVAIDASETAGDRPFEDVELVEILDERQSGEGKLIVEVRATGLGLMPAATTLLETEREGLQLSERDDSGVSVIEFEEKPGMPVVRSERTYTLTYAPAAEGAAMPPEFAFPVPTIDTKEVQYQRYVDADLESVDSVVALAGTYEAASTSPLIPLLLAAVILLVGLGAWFAFRGQNTPEQEVSAEATPLNAFTVLAGLRQQENAAAIPESRLAELRADIVLLERHYFSGTPDATTPDLKAISVRWL